MFALQGSNSFTGRHLNNLHLPCVIARGEASIGTVKYELIDLILIVLHGMSRCLEHHAGLAQIKPADSLASRDRNQLIFAIRKSDAVDCRV